jgi:hypothetical protein
MRAECEERVRFETLIPDRASNSVNPPVREADLLFLGTPRPPPESIQERHYHGRNT